MNKVAYKRWRDFSIRMAHKGWPAHEVTLKDHVEAVIPAVENFFSLMESDYTREIRRIESWDDTRTDHNNKNFYGHPEIGPFVCDIVDELLHDYNPFYYDDEEKRTEYEAWNELWGGRIHCCIRAGIDLASESSAGVIGFTVADIERMYPEGVPGWIRKGWEILSRNGEKKRPVNWEDIPKGDGLWT